MKLKDFSDQLIVLDNSLELLKKQIEVVKETVDKEGANHEKLIVELGSLFVEVFTYAKKLNMPLETINHWKDNIKSLALVRPVSALSFIGGLNFAEFHLGGEKDTYFVDDLIANTFLYIHSLGLSIDVILRKASDNYNHLSRIADKLKDRELFPEKIAEAKRLFENFERVEEKYPEVHHPSKRKSKKKSDEPKSEE